MNALEGPLSFATASAWFAQAEALSRAGQLSLAKVAQCDSAGLALLLELKRRAQRAQQPLHFTDVPQQLRELSGFFGLDRALGF
ncbi:ABC-type transporter Mla maintaining outer membrane lipid asymmetry, MlaB component, contains STAS domain [Solimonas aquatica]|uniref:ABC-type transporter Mla maintaining outer membrane lipid asymmetry, MlaB component, contains STAS domain n=1 Tax=Solimonas aquatica TaxID=489703 RepID=A0A1H9FWP8_9GAMM|nr:STAS domain-containing protein [Solimonas aquatica]SEQ41973.1 ABC-type transporter Mla maintaining outer membrane lipid asymmetry, MlaB component, contains STAS domain [Solimonas aquatica]